MLIISKFKDYYDGVVGTVGIDKTVIYKRDKIVFSRKDNDPSIFFFTKMFGRYWIKNNRNVSPLAQLTELKYYGKPYLLDNIKYMAYNYFVVGFCGKLYVGFKLFHLKPDSNAHNFFKSDVLIDIIYDVDFFKSLLIDNKKDNNNFDERYNNIVNLDVINIFREYNTPVFLYEPSDYSGSIYKIDEQFIINPTLKDYEFYKKFNTFQAFQEIQMFLGGVLGSNENNLIEIEDKYKIKKYGFDKWSFRKESEK